MVDSVKSEVCVSETNDELVKTVVDYGENLMVIPATNQIKELQTIIRDKLEKMQEKRIRQRLTF